MLQFNDLRISQDKKYLIIDVQVPEGNYFDAVYINSIIIDTISNFNATGGHSKKEPLDNFYIEFDNNTTTHYRQYIDIDGIPEGERLFFVWVNAGGNVSQDAPCCLKHANTILGVTYDKLRLYTQGMLLINSMDNCNISGELLDYILRTKAFDINLKAGNYYKAIEYWKLLKSIPNNINSNKCGCHGSL